MAAASYEDDLAALLQGSVKDGLRYVGTPVSPGFSAIRQPGKAVSVLVVLNDGYVAHGDCVVVQNAAYGGREGPMDVSRVCWAIERVVKPVLKGLSPPSIVNGATSLEALPLVSKDGASAIRYGVSQALLDARAWTLGITMAEAAQREYNPDGRIATVPIFAQCGGDMARLDAAILKRADALPHGFVGSRGYYILDELRTLILTVRRRVEELWDTTAGYAPTLHFDLYGSLSRTCNDRMDEVARLILELEDLARPYPLRLEGPIDAGSRSAQIHQMATLTAQLSQYGSAVELVADEWCNSLADVRAFADAGAAHMIQVKTPDLGPVGRTAEAMMYCRARGVHAYCGGSANETERAAQVSAHLAMACEASLTLAKPGLGVDEGLMVMRNEMARTKALVATPRG